MKRATIVLNGLHPDKETLRYLAGQSDLLIAADGGAMAIGHTGLYPDAVVGDLDSFHPEMLLEPRKTEIVRIEEQETTDAEKAIVWALSQGATDIVLTGTSGPGLDHVLGTLSAVARFARAARMRIVETAILAYFVIARWEESLELGATVSLIGLPEARGVRTTGLHWPLDGETLRFGEREGLRNRASDVTVRISIEGGCLVVLLPRQPGEEFLW